MSDDDAAVLDRSVDQIHLADPPPPVACLDQGHGEIASIFDRLFFRVNQLTRVFYGIMEEGGFRRRFLGGGGGGGMIARSLSYFFFFNKFPTILLEG